MKTRPVTAVGLDDVYVRFYDFIVSHTEELPLLTALARQVANGREPRVLELGAGSGRLAVPLAQAGCHVTALEQSAAMLALANRRGNPVPNNLTLVQGDMRRPPVELVPPRTFDLVVISSNTLCLVTDPEGQNTVLAAARDRLRPGGRLFIEQLSPPGFFAEVSGRRDVVHLGTRINPATGLATARFWSLAHDPFRQEILATTFVEEFQSGAAGGSVRHMFTERLRYNTFPELQLRLERAGFNVVTTQGGLKGEVLDAKSLKMVVIAEAV